MSDKPRESAMKSFFGIGKEKKEQSLAEEKRHESEKLELKNKLQETNNLLQARENQINELEAELRRFKLSESIKADPSSANSRYEAEIKTRDDKIVSFKEQLIQLERDHNEDIGKLNMQMAAVLDDKDHQIKRLNALAPIDEKKDGNMRTAISAEATKKLPGGILPVIKKTDFQRECIENALNLNTFMRSLSKDQFNKIIDAMEKKQYKAKVEIIREGEDGTQMFVLEKGTVTVTKGSGDDKKIICNLQNGTLFGELAILYNCRRTATITSTSDVILWSIDRTLFQTVIKAAGNTKDQERYEIVKSVNDLTQLSESKLRKIADCLEEENFQDSACIIKQGTSGDQFYIIRNGHVKITIKDGEGEKEVATKSKGEYFGEVALIKEDVRSANVYAVGNVQCYTLDRTAFTNLVGKISDTSDSTIKEIAEPVEDVEPVRVIDERITNLTFDQLKVIKPLGAGGFGMVKLVSIDGITDRAYALKCIQKHRVVSYGQQRHIMDEKNILSGMNSQFILRFVRTFKDKKFVYILTDAYLGGDLWRTLHTKGPFTDSVARFYSACVVEAFSYLHQKHFVYRDLKPENLMVDNNGYIKVVDLGFAKKILPGHKTWTFCGTPEYIPPEIISNTGHNIAADYWSLGILIFELLSKRTPFRAKDDLAIYEGILRGIHSIQFPYKISRKAESMVKALCRQCPTERIGYQRSGINDIRKHRWFQGFDWERLAMQTITAPHIPEIKTVFDASNFERIKEEDYNKIPDETSGWDADF